jgi:hypothetical protein
MRALIGADQSGDSAADGAQRATDHTADRACCAVSLTSSLGRAADYALREGGSRQREHHSGRRDSQYSRVHTNLLGCYAESKRTWAGFGCDPECASTARSIPTTRATGHCEERYSVQVVEMRHCIA